MESGDTTLRNEGFHPVAEAFPLMTGDAYRELVADVSSNGLLVPIWLWQNKVIDGRNRYRACVDANVEPQYREWDGEEKDLVSFVISLNLHRRHLSESQRAMVAAKLSNRPVGPTKSREVQSANNQDVRIRTSTPVPTAGEVAAMMNVGRGVVIAAKKVRREGAPEVVAAVESGDISVHAAEKIVNHPREEQKTAMEMHKLTKGRRQVRAAAETINATTDMSDKRETTIKLSIDTTDPESAASSVAAAFETDFLERFVKELGSLLARAKAAHERGMGPAKKG